LTYVATTGITIGHDGHTTGSVAIVPTSNAGQPPAAGTSVPGTDQRVTLRGKLTLDGAPLNAQFLGARVTTPDGLAGACQTQIPSVTNGAYEIAVAAEEEVHGCGTAGANVVLWTFVNDQTGFLF